MKTINRTSAKKKKKFLNKVTLKWFLLIALVAFAFWFYKDSMQEIWHGIRSMSLLQIAGSVLLAAVSVITEGLIIRTFACAFSPSFPLKQGVRIAYLCEFYRMLTLGSGSGVAEILYLQREGISYGRGTGMTLLQYVLKKVGIMVLGITGFAVLLWNGDTGEILRDYRGAMVTGIAITVVIVAALAMVALSVTVKNWLVAILDFIREKVPRQQERLKEWREQLILLNETGKALYAEKKRLAVLLLLEMLKLAVTYMIPVFVLKGKTSLTWAQGILLMAVTYMLSGVIPAPSGIGSLEFVFVLFFGKFALEADAIPAILVFRFSTWLVPFGIGAILYFKEKIKGKTQKM